MTVRGVVRKSVLETLVLAVIGGESAYGYEIARELGERGVPDVKGGTLYPMLARLAEAGFLGREWAESELGPGRYYYRLTIDGRLELDIRRERWLAEKAVVDSILTGSAL